MKTKLRKQRSLSRRIETQKIEFPDYSGKTRFQASSTRRIVHWQQPLEADEIQLSGGEDMLVPVEFSVTRMERKAPGRHQLSQKNLSERRLTSLHFSGNDPDFRQ